MPFAALGLSPAIVRVTAERGFTHPTPIQSEAIPLALAGHDLLGGAQTGTGKTAAFALPLLQRLAEEQAYPGGFEVTVNVEGGAELALKTMNPRLGILGGLSILGTSGIVRPFSCAAYIASIHQGIDVAKTNGYLHIAACTGNASEDTMRRVYNLPEIALIEMGDFVGAVLKHLRKVPVPRLRPPPPSSPPSPRLPLTPWPRSSRSASRDPTPTRASAPRWPSSALAPLLISW